MNEILHFSFLMLWLAASLQRSKLNTFSKAMLVASDIDHFKFRVGNSLARFQHQT